MEVLDLIQGSPEWLATRAKYFTASEAPAMMGASKYQTRNELLKQKATGLTPEVDAGKQYLFDRGHAAEAAARPIVEALLGEELFPCTGCDIVDGLPLSASFDGITMDESVVWENKLLNAELAGQVAQGALDDHYVWQLEHQLLVSGAEGAFFTTSDGTEQGTHGMRYVSDKARRAKLIAGWKQFAQDLADFKPVESAPVAVGKSVAKLPALVVSLVGSVTSSNLAVYKATAMEFIESINTELNTDQDFADAESVVKFCDKAEKELALVKDQALAQTATIDELFRTVDDLKEAMRAKRLSLERLVKERKESIRSDVVAAAKAKFNEHISSLNARIGHAYVRADMPDFAGAIKGKRNIDSLRDAVDTTLANAKIAASALADKIEVNLKTDGLSEYSFLFADIAALCVKDHDDFVALVGGRIAIHKAKESERIATEAARLVEQTKQATASAAAPQAPSVSVPRQAAPSTTGVMGGVIRDASPSLNTPRQRLYDLLKQLDDAGIDRVLSFTQSLFQPAN